LIVSMTCATAPGEQPSRSSTNATMGGSSLARSLDQVRLVNELGERPGDLIAGVRLLPSRQQRPPGACGSRWVRALPTESVNAATKPPIDIVINGTHYRAPQPVMTGAELAALPVCQPATSCFSKSLGGRRPPDRPGWSGRAAFWDALAGQRVGPLSWSRRGMISRR